MRHVHGGISPFSYKSQPGARRPAKDIFIDGGAIPAIDVSATGCFITGEEWLPGEFIIIPLVTLAGQGVFHTNNTYIHCP
jgi:hypothetical protein